VVEGGCRKQRLERVGTIGQGLRAKKKKKLEVLKNDWVS